MEAAGGPELAVEDPQQAAPWPAGWKVTQQLPLQ